MGNDEHESLIALANARMPYGRYEGMFLVDLPEPYVVWYKQKGFPKGDLGYKLAAIYEIKVNGLEYLLEPLKRPLPPPTAQGGHYAPFRPER